MEKFDPNWWKETNWGLWFANDRAFNRKTEKWERRARPATAMLEPTERLWHSIMEPLDWGGANDGPIAVAPALERWARGDGPRPEVEFDLVLEEAGATGGGECYAAIFDRAKADGDSILPELREMLLSHMETTADAEFAPYAAKLDAVRPRFHSKACWDLPLATAIAIVKGEFRKTLEAAVTTEGLLAAVANFGMGVERTIILPTEPGKKRKKRVVRFREAFLCDLLAAKSTLQEHLGAGSRLAYYFFGGPAPVPLLRFYNALLGSGRLFRADDQGTPRSPTNVSPFLGWLYRQCAVAEDTIYHCAPAATAFRWRPFEPSFATEALHAYTVPFERLDGFWWLWHYDWAEQWKVERGLAFGQKDVFAPAEAVEAGWLFRCYELSASELRHSGKAPNPVTLQLADEKPLEGKYDAAADSENERRYRKWLARMRAEYAACAAKESEKPRKRATSRKKPESPA